MKDRSLLVLLVFTVAFIFYVKPARDHAEILRARIFVTDAQIAAQEAIKRGSAEIKKRIKATGVSAAGNEAYLFPANQSSSLALAQLQEFVRTAASNCNMEIVTSTWGEAVPDPKSGVTRIPMTFTLKGVPPDFDAFLRKLLDGRQFIRIDRATISRYQDQQLTITLALVAFKRGVTP